VKFQLLDTVKETVARLAMFFGFLDLTFLDRHFH